MASIAAILRIIMQRSLGNWRLLATVTVGMVVSAALMASVVLYSDAIRDLGLAYALRQQDPRQLDLRIVSSSQTLRRQEYALSRDRTRGLINRYAGDIDRDTVRYGRTATFFLATSGSALSQNQDRPRAHFQFADRLSDHVQIVEGRAPRATEPGRDTKTPPTVEVLLGKPAAARLGVRVGDGFDLYPYWKPEAAPVRVIVSGLVEPNDSAEPYWFGKSDRFEVTTTTWPTYPFFTDERTAIEALAVYLPEIDASIETFVFVNTEAITSRNARSVERRVQTLEAALREGVERTTLDTQLPETIATYRLKLFFTRLPLFALILQIVGIVLYYLVMVSTMLVERQAGEIALLKSRGASVTQVLLIYAIEGLTLVALATVAGPLLATGAIALLGFTPAFSGLSEGGLLRVTLGPQAFVLALGGAMLAFAAILVPAYRASRYSIIHYKQRLARPPEQPIFLRYYLDLGVIAVAAFAFYQLRQRGSLVTEKLFGELSADPLLLLTPTLFMVMIALVFLRLFPLVLRAVAWLTRAMNGVSVPLGLSRMVRSPLHYSRLILLLILATAVGMFAAGFRATLEQSYDDRAAYQAGAEARIANVRAPTGVPNAPFVEAVQRATGATVVSPAVRLSGSYSLSQFRTQNVTLLGVVPEQFGQIATFRDDFAAASLADLLDRVRVSPASGDESAIEVPAGSRFIGVWVQGTLPLNVAQTGVRLQDRSGAFWEYRLTADGPATDDGWLFAQADLTRPLNAARASTGVSINAPHRLDSIYVRLAGVPVAPERVSLLFDDLQVYRDGPTGAGWQVIEPFENLDRYETLGGVILAEDNGSLSRASVAGRSGPFAARLAFTRARTSAPLVGLRTRGGGERLPVLVSDSFVKVAGKRTGDDIRLYINRQYVNARITGTFALFPTYDPTADTTFMVADLAAVQQMAARVPSLADGAYPNEAWLAGLGAPLTKERVTAAGVNAEQVLDRSALRAEQSSDPLVAASWEGILFLSLAAVLLLTALGFIVYSYLNAQTRALEFAILRTMGFSSRQILALVSFEQCFIIVAGMAAGTLLGLPLGRLMIGYMGITERGTEVVPPLVSRVSWVTVGSAYALLAVMFAATIGALVWLYSRLAVHRALRMGEL